MLDSGARGSKEQIRQLSWYACLMAKPQKQSLSTLFSTHGSRVKVLADTALKTADDAGYLTRRLHDVAQDMDRSLSRICNGWREEIAERIENCRYRRGIEIRTVLTCESKRGVCASCYGRNLASAQSIGEPGTQLTLRTFHVAWYGILINIAAESQISAKHEGVIEFENVRTVSQEGEDGTHQVEFNFSEWEELNMDRRYYPTLSILQYDIYNNPLEVKKNGIITILNGGYKGQYPIARGENTTNC
ncbi:hypothetical protein FQR65_LT18370 [Abscondita terminalis]|nr:hypothetical protein FQR65_LT18370 [Abscondita terminalis]